MAESFFLLPLSSAFIRFNLLPIICSCRLLYRLCYCAAFFWEYFFSRAVTHSRSGAYNTIMRTAGLGSFILHLLIIFD